MRYLALSRYTNPPSREAHLRISFDLSAPNAFLSAAMTLVSSRRPKELGRVLGTLRPRCTTSKPKERGILHESKILVELLMLAKTIKRDMPNTVTSAGRRLRARLGSARYASHDVHHLR